MTVDPTVFDWVTALALAVALSAVSGLRALLPILLTGLVARAGWVDLGPTFEFLSGNRALIIFGVAALLEIAGDKIPALDHALDTVHSFLRPLSGSLLAAAALSRVTDPTHALVGGIVLGAPTALVPHAVKSTARIASTVFTGGLANPFLSILEDVLAVVLFILAVVVPILAAVTVIVLMVLLARRLGRRAPAAAPAPVRGR
jgi:hypothetical protein